MSVSWPLFVCCDVCPFRLRSSHFPRGRIERNPHIKKSLRHHRMSFIYSNPTYPHLSPFPPFSFPKPIMFFPKLSIITFSPANAIPYRTLGSQRYDPYPKTQGVYIDPPQNAHDCSFLSFVFFLSTQITSM